jgi:hypothetical protein
MDLPEMIMESFGYIVMSSVYSAAEGGGLILTFSDAVVLLEILLLDFM